MGEDDSDEDRGLGVWEVSQMKRGVLDNLPALKRRERPFENRLRTHLESYHAIDFVKTKPTRRGFPDRLAIGYRKVVFVEVKRDDDEELAAAQEMVHKELRAKGHTVLVIEGPDVKQAARDVMNALKRGTAQ